MTPGAADDTGRYVSVDAVRGFAVLGILVMNIIGMGLPAYAHDDPSYYGGQTGADLWMWAVSTVLVEGKMRALFAMLFGASAVLVADRAAAPAGLHYSRMAWLFVIGVFHAVFLWWGDVLTTYALAGLFIFPLRRARPALLVSLGAGVLAVFVALNVTQFWDYPALASIAAHPGVDLDAAREAMVRVEGLRASPELAAQQVERFGGGFGEVLRARVAMVVGFNLDGAALVYLLEAFGLMLVGMGLLRLGFFTLAWRTASYLKVMAAGYLVAAPVSAVLAFGVWKSGFDPVTLYVLGAWQTATWAIMGLAHASALLLLIRSGAARGVVRLLAGAGRMALSNYLLSSLITTLVFSGFGLGLYGKLSRAELLWVVAGVWAFILAWSAPWLSRFRYGPFEWLWRSLARGKAQPFVR